MTLADLANLICTKLNQLDAEDVAACKLFLQRRYEMIWNDQLWKDALIDWTYPLPASGAIYAPTDLWMPTKQILMLPAVFDRVVAVRTDSRRMNVQSPELFYRADYDSFKNAGLLIDYIALPPVVWELDTAQDLYLLWGAADNTSSATLDYVTAAGEQTRAVTQFATKGGNTYALVTNTSRVDGFSRVAGNVKLSLTMGSPGNTSSVVNTMPGATVIGTVSSNGTTTATFTGVAPHGLSVGEAVEVRGSVNYSGNYYVLAVVDVYNFTFTVVPAGPSVENGCTATPAALITFLDATGAQISSLVLDAAHGPQALPAGTASITATGGYSLTLPSGFGGTVTFNGAGFTYAWTEAILVSLAAATVAAPRRARIRLVGSVETPAPTIRVLGKAKPNTLSADQDSTMLTGVDNALIAAAEFDMLQRERQYGKAELKFKEFGAHLEQLKRQEVVQQAYTKRIIPEDGYGNPYDMWSHPPLSF